MNIYIGNLNYKVREDDLFQILSDFTQVKSVKLIMDHETGRSRGFAFAEVENDDAGKQIISELNGAEFEGRTMVVKEARPRN